MLEPGLSWRREGEERGLLSAAAGLVAGRTCCVSHEPLPFIHAFRAVRTPQRSEWVYIQLFFRVLVVWKTSKETTPTANPPPTEEEKTESNQEVANPEHYIKHPLQNRWALWFFKNDKSKTWQANLRLISKFDTVEDFWALYNHIQLSSNLMPGCDYSLFKDGIEPMWEDEKNKRGGRWLITLNKQQRRSDLDRFWLETLLCLIGESFDDYSDDVCGAVVNVRAKGDKIAIWTTECENRDAVTHIGRVYKERLGLPPKIVIGYQSHADTATKSGSTTKNRFVV
ncbi:eukaryotic translation initiation factor 4E isoform X1 [Diceros bicornis minor]|uniref:eukaryotic translation initiation factor 4E isoform X1 n=1 Tax=Diceros bicornis minor TaxID=77932 RepID=UPI0026F2A7EC|nr:eukaryotic translation initiation factor 4E isoform X1 [Diceros bicornis minor]